MITTARIVAVGANPESYHAQVVERGDPKWIMGSGSLREFDRCPDRWLRGYENPDTKAKEWGSLLDCLLLTPEQFESRYAERPATYTHYKMVCPECGSVSDAKSCRKCHVDRLRTRFDDDWNALAKECKEWKEQQEGKVIVTAEQCEEAHKAKGRLLADPILAGFIGACDTQVWIASEWHDPDTGLVIPCRALPDFVARADSEFPKVCGDLKTTRNASPMAWQRWCYQAGYHVQAAFHLDQLQAAKPEEVRDSWVFVVQENFPPYQIGRRMLSQDFLQLGRLTYQRALRNYCLSLKNNIWPDYDAHDEALQGGWTLVEPLPWMVNEDEFAPHQMFEYNEPEQPEPESEDAAFGNARA